MWWPYCTLPMVFQSKDITAAACAAFINRAGRICFFLLQLYFFVRLFVEIVYLFVFSLHLLICKAGDFGLFDLSSIISLKFFLRLFINFSFFLLNLILFIKKGQKSFWIQVVYSSLNIDLMLEERTWLDKMISPKIASRQPTNHITSSSWLYKKKNITKGTADPGIEFTSRVISLIAHLATRLRNAQLVLPSLV